MKDFYTVKEAGANLSRLMSHLNEDDVCFISAFRNENDYSENMRRTKQLALDIYNIGLSFIKTGGGYKEINKETGQTQIVEEKSFAVIHKPESKESQNEFFDEMIGLCKKYDQDAVLIKMHNREDIPTASYSQNGEIVYGPFTKLTTQDVEEFFTKIHNHKFKMESYSESIETNEPKGMTKSTIFYGTKQQLKMLGKVKPIDFKN